MFKILLNLNLLVCVFGRKPNIVFILSDDMGWNDVGFHGSNQIPTPNIDALAYNGVVMNRYYTQHICTPSRAALLTGNYPIRSAMQGYPLKPGENRSIPTEMRVLPERLKELGYKTHLVGKWHVGFSYKKYTPNERGFDTFFGYWNGFISYVNYNMQYNNEVGNDGFDLHENTAYAKNYEGTYATNLFTDKSLEIIDNHDTNEPLFLMISHLAPHSGNEDNMNALTTPDLDETNQKFGYVEDPRRRNYTDIVYQLDRSIGRVVEKLSEKKILENSIIIYSNDNGAQTSGDFHMNSGSNWPLRGQKFTLFEGSVRGTCAVYSPLIKNAPYVNENLMHISDWLPTLYEAAGGDMSKLGILDGISQWDNILNNKASRNELLVNIDERLNYSAYIDYSGQYKLVNSSYQRPDGSNIYDVYAGDTGRGANNPKYNISEILESPTNLAISKITSKTITKQNIIDARTNLDISVRCRQNISNKMIDCKEKMCLFDLFDDPCETTNIIDEFPEIGKKISIKMQDYYNVLVPQKPDVDDETSNPKLCDGYYFSWLEENACPFKKSGGDTLYSYTMLSTALVLSITLSLYYF